MIPGYPVDNGPTPPAAKVRVKNGWVSLRARLATHYFFLYFHRRRVDHVFLDNTEWSGDQYAQQARYGLAGHGSTGQQRSDDWGQGRAGAGRTLDPSNTSTQYGGSERTARDQTGGYSDPTTGGDWQGERDERDDVETAGTGGEKPSVTSKVKGKSSLL